MATRICPVELHLCHRPGCAMGYCEMSMERLLTACGGCGVLVTFHRLAICIDCEQAEATSEQT